MLIPSAGALLPPPGKIADVGLTAQGLGGYWGFVYSPKTHNMYAISRNGFVEVISPTNSLVANLTLNPLLRSLRFQFGIYDPANQNVYFVARAVYRAGPPSLLYAVSPTNQIVANITLGHDADSIIYNSMNKEIWVANHDDGTITVVSMLNQVSRTIVLAGADGIMSMAYDPANKEVFVLNAYPDNSTIIVSSKTYTALAVIPLVGVPQVLTFNPSSGQMIIGTAYNETSISGGGFVYAIGVRNAMVAMVRIGGWPEAMAYSPARGAVYVADWSNTTSMIKWGRVAAAIPVGYIPSEMAYSTIRKALYVVNSESNSTTVIGRGNTVLTTLPLDGFGNHVAYFPAAGEVFVSHLKAPITAFS